MSPTVRTLVVLRHAKSSWKTNDPDIDRPLSPRGSRDAVVAGQLLARLPFDLVLLSPARRAQQTWQSLGMGGARGTEVRTVEEIYHGRTTDLLEALRELPDSAHTVLLVGHEPTLSDLILGLVPTSPMTDRIEVKFPTSAVAVLTQKGSWSDLGIGTAQLEAFEVPRG